ncbi:hypothetical protein FRC08_014297 [Ceratobasidium sp. 394]|nr:hypothetical protein FRC08_014297 [Ceratobasidium sp. 394]
MPRQTYDLNARHRAAGHVHKRARPHFDEEPSQHTSEPADHINNTKPNGDPDAASEASSDKDKMGDDETVNLEALTARLAETINKDDNP